MAKRKRVRRETALRMFSPATLLWFGKHNGKPIQEVPIAYLCWIRRQKPICWRFAYLKRFLREYLKGNRGRRSRAVMP